MAERNEVLTEATKYVTKWRKLLCLEQFTIRLFVDESLPLSVRGRCYWESRLTDATVVINQNINWKVNPLEKTVIHELLHLSLAETGDPSPEYVERHICLMAELLYQKYKEVWA